jgi:hypothetical protein
MKQIKLELFSPINDGQIVNETVYLKHILEYAQKEWKGITITEAMVKKLWAKVKKSEYPTDTVADEVAEMYERMAADFEAANDLLETIEIPPEIIVNDTEEEDTQEDECLELINSVKDGMELSSFTQKFDLGGMTQCVPKGDVDAKDWVKAFAFGLTLESGSQWIIGDSVVALENAGYENVVNQLCAQFKKSYSTVSNYARTCRVLDHESRDPMLPFTVHLEVATADLSEDKIKSLLAVAKEEKLSSQEVRGKVREAQGKEDKMKSLPHRYLILNVQNWANSEVVSEVPKAIEAHHLLIDTQAKTWFDAAENEWMKFLTGK